MQISQVGQNWVTVGRIKTSFGVKGWLKVESFTQPASNILQFKEWFIERGGQFKPLMYDEIKQSDKELLVHFPGLDNPEDAQQYRQCLIQVPGDTLPSLESDEYYWHQLTGLSVYQRDTSGDRYIGLVDHLLETGANDVLVVKCDSQSETNTSTPEKKPKEILIPYLPGEVVKQVDLNSGSLFVDWYYD